ncbi:MAG: hypothetical protein R2697_16920 [Ilumatobacteraceae bacterium]
MVGRRDRRAAGGAFRLVPERVAERGDERAERVTAEFVADRGGDAQDAQAGGVALVVAGRELGQ